MARGDDILEKYIKEANEVKNTDESLREAYDHEAAMVQSAREDGYEEGHESGFVEGEKQKEVEIARKMLADGLKPDMIKKYVSLSLEEIQDLQSE